jgi:ATP-binding cassette subfamily F protein 3
MLQINALVFDAYGRRFFDGANLTLAPGVKAGLVGLNGVGKSTLFKLILGHHQPGGGEILMPKGWRVASVDQEIAASPQHLIDAVLALDTRRANLLKALETADPMHQAEIHHDLYAIQADRAPSRAAEILSGLGFSNADLTRSISDFSGGWRMRAALAGALLAEPDLLLLDEPTNYLDLEGALWLEAKLKRYPNAALMISHDRDLLNEAVDAIVHVTGQKLDYYSGNYDNFEQMRAEKARLNAANRAKQEAERAHLQGFIDRFGAKASKATQAQSRMKKLAKLPPIAANIEDRVAPFLLPSPEKQLAPPVLRLEDVSIGYDDAVILRNVNIRLDPDDRSGVLGVNGAGKSTFAKLLAGALSEKHGVQWRDRRMTVAWFHQHQIEAMDPEDTPLEMMRRVRPEETESKRRARLGSFGMTVEKVETKVKDLSGGERARLLLNMVAMDGPHLLILDEPTNHLDIDSRRALLDALNDYEGAVLIITHDRSLVELVADRLWLVDQGTVKTFTGSMDDYAKLVIERAKTATREETAANAAPKQANVNSKEARKAAAAARQAIAPLKKKADDLERKIETTGNQIKLIDHKLADPDIYTKDKDGAVSLGKDKVKLESDLVRLESEWMEAAEAYENARIESGV